MSKFLNITHVFGLLYLINSCSKGDVKEAPSSISKTSLPMTWNKPRTQGLTAEPVMHCDMKKAKAGQSKSVSSTLYEARAADGIANIPALLSTRQALCHKPSLWFDIYGISRRSDFWANQINNKLHSVQPTLGCESLSNRDRRREQLVLCRLRLGHTYTIHRYLLAGEDPPVCISCQEK